MALQVWLPLNKNEKIENRGLSDITISGNPTYVSSGKLGGCFQFNSKMISIPTNSYMEMKSGNSFSVAFWVKGTSTGWLLACNAWEFRFREDYIQVHPGPSGATPAKYTTTTTSTQWRHCAFTWNNDTLILYVDGILRATSTFSSNFNIDSTLWLCFDGTRYLNDFRIYNHCLSPKEIKEISKGLVLHYKMDDVCTEDLPNLITGLTAGGQTTVSNGVVTTSGVNSDTYFTLNLSESVTVGTTYKISCYAEIQNGNYWCFPLAEQGNSALTWTIRNGYNEYYFTANSANWGTKRCFMDDYEGTARSSGLSTKMWNFRLVKSPGGKIHDCSGFGYNGTINGTLVTSSDTSRYSVSTVFNGSDSSILLGNLSTMIPEGVFTFNCWFKKTDWGSKSYETIFGGPSGFELDCKNNSTNSPVIVAYSWGGWAKAYSLNTWNMITMVRTASDTKFYLNGELAITGTAGTIPSGNYFIGAWSTSTQQNYKGNISDVRIYVTPLSAEDVKELYNTSAVICDNGTVMAYSLEE